MKKVSCIILTILLLMGCIGCAADISHPSGTAVRICYDRENVSFDLELSQEEANVVLSVLNGKQRDTDMTVTGAACGFGREQLHLRNLILDNYPSLRQFALEADIPYSSLMTILSRGVGGASFDLVMQICRKLNIDPASLSESNGTE